MHGELAGLAELAATPSILTGERLLTSMNVCVLFQVLGESERFKAKHTNVTFV